jgi:hypothetical protein
VRIFQKLTNTGQKAGPINGPTSNRVGTQFSFDSLRILAVTVLPTIADWSLLRVGNWTHFNCPKSVSDGFHGQKADIRAPASALFSGSPVENARARGRETGGGERRSGRRQPEISYGKSLR